MLAEHDKHCSSAILGTVSTIFASLVLTWFWSSADVCKLTPLIRKSASVGFTWFTLNISSGLLVSADSLKNPRSQQLVNKRRQQAVLGVPFYLKQSVHGEAISNRSVMFSLWGS